jgi:hypothetical protein
VEQAGDQPPVLVVGEEPDVEAEPAVLDRLGDPVQPAR